MHREEKIIRFLRGRRTRGLDCWFLLLLLGYVANLYLRFLRKLDWCTRWQDALTEQMLMKIGFARGSRRDAYFNHLWKDRK
jgi:hypothetical protein